MVDKVSARYNAHMTRQQLYDAMSNSENTDRYGLTDDEFSHVRNFLEKSVGAGNGDKSVRSMMVNFHDSPHLIAALSNMQAELEVTLDGMDHSVTVRFNGPEISKYKDYLSDIDAVATAMAAEQPDGQTTLVDMYRNLGDVIASGYSDESLRAAGLDPDKVDQNSGVYDGSISLNSVYNNVGAIIGTPTLSRRVSSDIQLNDQAWDDIQHADGSSNFEVVPHGAGEFTAMYANNQFSAKELVGMGLDPASLTINFKTMASGESVVGQPESPSARTPTVNHDSFTV